VFSTFLCCIYVRYVRLKTPYLLTYLFKSYSLYLLLEPDSLQCQRQAVSVLGVDVEMVCELKYYGRIQPILQWLMDGKDKPVNGTLRVTDGKVKSRLTVSATDPSLKTTKCQVTFDRQSCNQPRLAYTRTVQCYSNDDSKYDFLSKFCSMYLYL